MTIRRHQEGKTLVLTIDRPFVDASCFEAVREAILAEIQDASQVVVDLSPVGMMDSSGVGVLLSVHRALLARRGKLVLCGAREAVKSLLSLVNIPRLIPVFPTLAEAFSAFPATG